MAVALLVCGFPFPDESRLRGKPKVGTLLGGSEMAKTLKPTGTRTQIDRHKSKYGFIRRCPNPSHFGHMPRSEVSEVLESTRSQIPPHTHSCLWKLAF